MKKLMKLVAGFPVVVVLAASANSLYAEQKGVGGGWTLSAEGYVLEMVLAQNGKKITGTLQGPHGPMPLKDSLLRAGSPFPVKVLMASAAVRNFRRPQSFKLTVRLSALSRALHQVTCRGEPFAGPADSRSTENGCSGCEMNRGS